MSRRTFADLAAGLVVVVVLVVGLVCLPVLHGEKTPPPLKTTTVTRKAIAAAPAVREDTVVVTRVAGRRTQTTTTHESEPVPARPEQVTTTREEGAKSLFERAAGDNGLRFVRLGILVLAAFVSGALVQRAIMGSYGIKIGAFEIADVARESASSVDTLRAELQRLRNEMSAELKAQQSATTEELAKAFAYLAHLERKIGDVPGQETA